MSNIQDAINQAKAAAEQAVPTDTGGAVIEAQITPQGQVQAMPALSLTNFRANTGLLPRNTVYLKPTDVGLQIGKNKKNLVDDFEAEIEMTWNKGIVLKHTMRYGNPAQYFSSYDNGVTSNKGGSWGDAVAKARLSDPNCEPFPAAEMKLVLTKPIKFKDETFEAGTIIGYDTSAPSRYDDVADFLEAVSEAGKLDQTVKVKVKAEEINHNGNSWGSVTFELLD